MIGRRTRRFGIWPGILAAGSIFLVWGVVVGVSAAGVDLFHIAWSYERMGQLGDSFGVVSAIMTSLAAGFTYVTMQSERESNRELLANQRRSERRERNSQAEATFFRLLEARRSVIEGINFEGIGVSGGQMAFDYLINLMPEINNLTQSRLAYKSTYDGNKSGLGHYLRLTYHVVKFADEHFLSDRKRYEMIRLLRAELSNSELLIISMNCAFGEGYRSFRPLAEKYALFHNIPKEQISYYKLKSKISASAFSSKIAKLGLANVS